MGRHEFEIRDKDELVQEWAIPIPRQKKPGLGSESHKLVFRNNTTKCAKAFIPPLASAADIDRLPNRAQHC